MIKLLPDNCNTVYADLYQKVLLPVPVLGTIVSKKIKGTDYLYEQVFKNGIRQQNYIGKDCPELRKSFILNKEKSNVIIKEKKRLVAMLCAAGANFEKGRPSKILKTLETTGIFKIGAVLVGSFAYSCYGNMLGFENNFGLARTTDMDFAVERKIEISEFDLPEILKLNLPEFEKGKDFSPFLKSFDFISEDGFSIKFLTLKNSTAEKSPLEISYLNINAQPLDYMDYLMESNVKAVVVAQDGILVNVPTPGRFALHKLAVSQLRPICLTVKSKKDISQAESILTVLLEDNPGEILLAFDGLKDRFELLKHVVEGAKKLTPEVFGKLNDLHDMTNIHVNWNEEIGGFTC